MFAMTLTWLDVSIWFLERGAYCHGVFEISRGAGQSFRDLDFQSRGWEGLGTKHPYPP